MSKELKRVYHTWDKWECYPAGFYATSKKGMSKEECEQAYADFLSDADLFLEICMKIIEEWEYSCEHYLTNANMNRIAWMGQAALAYHLGIPACYRGGYNKLTEEQKLKADRVAMCAINTWLTSNDYPYLEEEEFKSKTVANLY